MIGIDAGHQGRGHGTTLLRAVEADLTRAGQRLLLVETSGTADFAATRRFYDTRGYTSVASITDYYTPGDDLIVYRRDLTTP